MVVNFQAESAETVCSSKKCNAGEIVVKFLICDVFSSHTLTIVKMVSSRATFLRPDGVLSSGFSSLDNRC